MLKPAKPLLTISCILWSVLALGQQDTNKVVTSTDVAIIKETLGEPYDSPFPRAVTYSTKGILSVGGSFYWASNALTNRLAGNFYFRQAITDDILDDNSERLAANNRFGVENHYTVHYLEQSKTLKLFKQRFHYYVAAGHHSITSARFGSDLFELVARGNKPFVDQTANLDEFQLMSLRYQDFKWGLQHYGNKLNWSAGVGLVRGSRGYDFTLNSGSLYTAPDGEYIDTEMDLEIRSYHEFSNRVIPMNGIGGVAEFKAELIDNTKKSVWRFGFEDAGFITWNNQSSINVKDSAYRFDGWEIPTLDILSDSTATTNSIDSLIDRLAPNERKESFTQLLPLRVFITYQKHLPKGRVDAGLNYRYIPGYLPAVYCHYFKQISKRSSLGGGVQLGGWGWLDLNAFWEVYLKGNWKMGTGIRSLEGLALANNASGLGGSIRLTKYFIRPAL